MGKTKETNLMTGADLIAMRNELGLTQAEFWAPIGTTQSGGSRYEAGRNIPPAVVMLVYLRYVIGLTKRQLEALEGLV